MHHPPTLHTEAAFNAILPPKADITLWKLSNKCNAWAIGSTPLFFDLDGRGGAVLPTVYALWASPVPLLPEITTHSEVTPKLMGGADLFLQGFVVPPHGLPRVLAGDLVVVRAPGAASRPFAVGVMETSADDAAAAGMKGKGVKLLHHYPDGLWSLGDKRTPGPEFTPARVFAAGDGPAAGADAPAAAAASDDEEDQGKDGASAADAAASQVAALDLDSAPPPPAPTTPGLPPDIDPDTPAGQDALAEYCLLAALAGVADSDLPMLTSDLYSKHMVPAKPAGVTLDLKKSSFKQLSKLLKKYEKAGLLATKLVRKQDNLAKVDRGHALYRAFAPAAAAAAAAREEAAAASAEGSSKSGAAVAAITVESVYKPSPMVRPIMAHAKAADDDLLTDAAVRAALKAYCKAEGLRGSGSKSATLDKLLVGALFSKREREDEGVTEGDALPLSELGDRLVARLTAHTRVTRALPGGGVATATRRGALTKLRVTVEDRHAGRKHLTKIVGAEAYALDPDTLATTLQRTLKTSASVSKLPGKDATDKEVALQGDLLREVVAWLEKEAGIGGQHVEAVNKR